jgi:hypothetical protein
MISFVVVEVESHLANCEHGFDREWIVWVECSRCEVLVNVIHSWDHGGKVGCAT